MHAETLLKASEGLFFLHIHARNQKGASAVFPLLPTAADGDANHFPEIDPNKHSGLLLLLGCRPLCSVDG